MNQGEQPSSDRRAEALAEGRAPGVTELPSFESLCGVVAFTAVYFSIRDQLAKVQVLLSRENFVMNQFAALVDADDMMAIAQAGKPVKLVLTMPAPRGGLRERIYRQ